MQNYKLYFRKNFFMMLLLVFTILIAYFVINLLLSNNNLKSTNLGGSFILTDHNGNTFDSKKIKLKKLIYFGYTYCPDICPFDLIKISNVFEKNPDLKNKLIPIFITVDPVRDSVEKLNEFIKNFNPAFSGLTGNNKEINHVLKKFKIYVKVNKKNHEDLDYLVDHSSLIFLIDENDKYINFYRPKDLNTKSFLSSLEKII